MIQRDYLIIGAGIGGLAGLGAVLLTRGPEAELPRGSTLDIVIERAVLLDGSQIQYTNVGASSHSPRRQRAIFRLRIRARAR